MLDLSILNPHSIPTYSVEGFQPRRPNLVSDPKNRDEGKVLIGRCASLKMQLLFLVISNKSTYNPVASIHLRSNKDLGFPNMKGSLILK